MAGRLDTIVGTGGLQKTMTMRETMIETVSAQRADEQVEDYLGAGVVVDGSDARTVRVRLADSVDGEAVVSVRLALAVPYEPEAGDELLVAGRSGHYFVVGVLSRSLQGQLLFPGDTEIRAVGGTLTLGSDRGVEVEAPRVTVRTGVFRLLAGSVVEKADRMFRWVRGLMVERTGQSERTIDGEDHTRCDSSVTLAKGPVKIDGDQLHLGH